MVAAKISYVGIGQQDGLKIHGALDKALTLMKSTAIQRAIEFAGDTAKIDDYLDGYGKVMGKNRKSEFRAIIEAHGVNSDKVTALAEKETYQKLYEACVVIRGRKQAARGKGNKVTADQHKTIVEKIALMDAPQSAQVLQVAANHAVTLGGDWERKILNQITGLALILDKSTDNGYKATGAKLFKIASEMTQRLDAQDAKRDAKPDKSQGLPAAPAPLVNEQQPAEQQAVA